MITHHIFQRSVSGGPYAPFMDLPAGCFKKSFETCCSGHPRSLSETKLWLRLGAPACKPPAAKHCVNKLGWQTTLPFPIATEEIWQNYTNSLTCNS